MLLSAAHPVAAAVPPKQRSQLHPLGTSALHSPVHQSSCSLHLRKHKLQHTSRQHSITCRALLDPMAAVAHMSDHDHAEAAGWPSLLLTCMLMFLGAYGCGMLPGWLPNQQRLTSSVSAVGAGLLLGSALCIILPEGFEAAMEAEHHLPGWAISATLLCGFWLMLLLDSLSHWLPGAHSHSSGRSHLPHRSLSDAEDSTVLNTSDLAQGRVLQGQAEQRMGNISSEEHTVLLTDFAAQQDPSSAAEASEAGVVAIGGAGALHTQQTTSRRPCASPTKNRAGSRSTTLPGTSPNTTIGGASPAAAAAAATGGVCTASSREVSGGGSAGSVRRLATGAAGSGSFSHQAAAAAARGGGNNVGSGSGAAAADSNEIPAGFDSISRAACTGTKDRVTAVGASGAKGVGSTTATAGEWWRPWVVDPTHHALLGLLVHSVSDGLAVGAASLSTVPEISLGVATAMVVHKGPVAIGLATFLRSALWSPAQVHRGVLMFAAASPLAAVLTYGLLSAIPGITDNIPLVVLFSGGTVLYAATMHILPGAMQHSSSSSSGKGQQHQHGGSLDRTQLIFVSLGMLLPMILSAAFGGHHHHHH